jgi:hypothetical protein
MTARDVTASNHQIITTPLGYNLFPSSSTAAPTMKISFCLLSMLSVVSLNYSSAFAPISPLFLPSSTSSLLTLRAGKGTATDIPEVRSALAELVKEKNCGPILIRLAWHDSATYSKEDGSGGPRGGMRLEGEKSEANFGANNGLDVARDLVESIKDELAPEMSFADFWALASIVAIKEM